MKAGEDKNPTFTEVFVYGTLMNGEVNHHLLESSRFLGGAKTNFGYELANFGWYPAMIIGDNEKQVAGEVYLVNSEVLRAMDRLEGHPHYYRRVHVLLENDRQVQTYLFPRQKATGMSCIISGNWRMRSNG